MIQSVHSTRHYCWHHQFLKFDKFLFTFYFDFSYEWFPPNKLYCKRNAQGLLLFEIELVSRVQIWPECTLLYSHIHNDETIKTSDTVLWKYTSHFIWKGCMWEGVGDRTELQHIDPHSTGHNCVSFPFSWAAQPEAWGPASLGAGFLYRILSPTGLVSKLTDFLSSPSYIIVERLPPSCGRHNCLHSTHQRSRL